MEKRKMPLRMEGNTTPTVASISLKYVADTYMWNLPISVACADQTGGKA